MKISLSSRQCPKCTNMIFRDFQTGPGAWFWCDTCNDFTIIPEILKTRKEKDEKEKVSH